jgi:hypothetical protein
VDIEPDNPHSILIDVVFRRCQFSDNNGCGVQMIIGALQHDTDAPMSILFEDCDVNWREVGNKRPGAQGSTLGLSLPVLGRLLAVCIMTSSVLSAFAPFEPLAERTSLSQARRLPLRVG